MAALQRDHGLTPGLAVVLVGENPASHIYVRNKNKQTLEVGMKSFEHDLPADTSQDALLALVRQLNDDPKVHGILVQLRKNDSLLAVLVVNSNRSVLTQLRQAGIAS